MYIIKPNLEEERYAATIEKYNALIQSNGGEVVKTEPWGKRHLAYEIDKLREGYYVLLHINGPAELPKELERNFKIADEIMRYLVVRMGE
jgi:small subunit ribosomal protein S6